MTYSSFVTESNTFTALSTFLPEGAYFTLFSLNYSEYGMYFQINGTTVNYAYVYAYDETTGTDMSRNCSFTISKAFEYGDKIALIMDNRTMRLYKNTELVGEAVMDADVNYYGFSEILNYQGLKKNFAYFPNTILPLSSVDGKNWQYNYSIEDWVNEVPVPSSLNNGIFTFIKNTYPSAYKGNISNCIATGGASIGDTSSVMKVSSSVGKASSRKIELQSYSDPSIQRYGHYKLKFKIYIPSSNVNLKRVQIRVGSFAISNYNMTLHTNVDANGFITALDSWTQVEVDFKPKAIRNSMTGKITLYSYGTTTTAYDTTTVDSDVFYITNLYVYGYEGCEVYYKGNTSGGYWKSFGKNDIPLISYDGISYPNDVYEPLIRTYEMSSFSSGYYDYFEGSLNGYDLSQIILFFNETISVPPEESEPNVFKVSINSMPNCCEETLPAISVNTAYNIYPKFGISDGYVNSISVEPMYSCSCGGKVILIFTKTK